MYYMIKLAGRVMNITKEIDILRVEDGVSVSKADTIAVERTIHIYVNGQRHAVLTATPQNLEELVLGQLLSTGKIRDLKDVGKMSFDVDFRTVQVETSGGSAPLIPVSDGLCVPVDDILFNMDNFLQNKSVAFRNTGALHACALIVDGRILHFMEDIGRHNALDKTIGRALCEKTSLDRAVVLTSGRMPGDIMAKIIQSRAQIVVSRSAPTDAGVQLALDNNVTLCGFARKDRINIYTGKQRIIMLNNTENIQAE